MTVKVEVTKAAQDQVRQLMAGQKPGTAVRVFVQAGGGGGGCCSEGSGGGCGCGASSGPAFGLAFDKPRNGDEVVPVDGFSVIVDSLSAAQLDGAKIDFVDGLESSGFMIVAPHSAEPAPPSGGGGGGCGGGACGCGSGGNA